ncbi:MAG TPA: hypothetical protein VL051_14225 [Burkholderiaceae bacterium]|nr:hypothetical protein [Burkholderiaceae bacterium]
MHELSFRDSNFSDHTGFKVTGREAAVVEFTAMSMAIVRVTFFEAAAVPNICCLAETAVSAFVAWASACASMAGAAMVSQAASMASEGRGTRMDGFFI